MCIKGIVFFCFWQGVVLKVLAALGIIKSHHFWLDVEHIEEAIRMSCNMHTMFRLTVETLNRIGKTRLIPDILYCIFGECNHGVVLKVLAALGIIQSHHFWLAVEHIEEAIQNVLVCLEMVVFSVLQQHAYHVSPYSGGVESKFKLNKKDK
ncbi:hypothetical protein CFP56_032497 [Quercus suber]|uniref:Uncharacterized protein n=1 Tax=Quercus suber TaxID=58331 RepID=A0AAW0JHI4_QUESU